MITYAKLALIALQVVQFFLRKAHDDKQFAAGEEHQIAEQTKAVLGMTAEGKRLLEKINALSDGDLDDLTDAVGNAGKG
ncbi:hypothetical protein [Bradyrhizobium retamae]|uniref:Uncharacterized protein n=1 Tax=Bradyrhizobium retamae TaxID=1300035 RepID=A0A0R3MDX2_9BRAD|nr:hypothetical protein [Bradyrhizobium retamae]KRR18139.1 hypothetical protein CQ13_35365 [Bradyrhizobium retamae]